MLLTSLMDSWTTLLFILIAGSNAVRGNNERLVCINEACNITAQIILNNMDFTVNPCEDFYDFACGNLVKNGEINPDETENSAYTEIDDIIRNRLKTAIQEPPRTQEPNHSSYIKKLYRMCVDEDKKEVTGLTRAAEEIRKAGGWPILNQNWNEKKWNYLWQEVQLSLLLHGSGILIAVGVMVDTKNSTRRLVHVDQPTPGLSREYLIKGFSDRMVQAYYQYMVNVAVLFGANREETSEEFIKCINLEVDIAKITSDREARRDFNRMYNKYTIEELSTGPLGWIDWMHLFVGILPTEVMNRLGEIVVMETEYFVRLKRVLDSYSKRTVANWMIWRAVQGLGNVLTNEIKHYKLQFDKSVRGLTNSLPNWQNCLHLIASKFPLALSSMYIKNYFDPSTKSLVMEMAEHVRLAMYKVIEEVTWMDELTKNRAREKIGLLIKSIGYPQELLDERELEKHYEYLAMNTNTFLDAWIEARRFSDHAEWLMLEKPVLRFDWKEHGKVFESNAYFDNIENSIDFPAAILQLPFYHSQRPLYLNYGAIGSVMGHEITHGYDDQGNQFNGLGELIEWWDDNSKLKFKEKVQCVIDQYNLFKETFNGTDLHVNGVNTQGENVADIGGLRLAYRAYLDLNVKDEQALPGLEHYTPEQLMLLSTANVWCTKMRPDGIRDQLTTGTHTPPKFRVNGMMMDFQEFGKIFRCRPGTPMHPLNKCHVW